MAVGFQQEVTKLVSDDNPEQDAPFAFTAARQTIDAIDDYQGLKGPLRRPASRRLGQPVQATALDKLNLQYILRDGFPALHIRGAESPVNTDSGFSHYVTSCCQGFPQDRGRP